MSYKSAALDYFEWQQPVITRSLVDPPGGETKGDRYLIDGVGINAWAGEDGNIATYNGAGWDFTDKKEGMFVYVMDLNLVYLYIAAWTIANVTTLANLTDLAVVRGHGGDKGVKTSTMLISDAGEMTNPSQPAFLAYKTSGDVNVTGDNTAYKNDFDGVVFDQGGDYAVDTFTAPVEGRYLLKTTVTLDDMNADTYERAYIGFITSNRNIYSSYISGLVWATGGILTLSISVITDMDANDTAYVTLTVSGGAKSVDILGHAVVLYSYFSGALIC